MKQHYSSLIFFLICFIFFESCDKKEYTYEEFEAPTIEIISTKIISDNECEVEIKIDMGVGAFIEEASVELINITTEEVEPTYQEFKLTKEKTQLHNIKIKMAETRNDYRIKAILKSQKNEYTSRPSIVRFTEEIVQTGITHMELYLGDNESDFFYVDELNKIGRILKGGNYFLIIIHYSKIPPQTTKFEVKLNGEIPIESEVSYSGWSENGSISAGCTLPTGITPGIYPIHVYVNDVEYILEYKINVIRGVNRIIELDNMPYDISSLSNATTHFVNGDEVYYIHSEYNPAKMIIYNPKTHKWSERNISVVELPYIGNFNNEKIVNGTEEYLTFTVYTRNPFDNMLTSDSQWIVSFDKENNQWKKITDYPGQGTNSLIGFGINNKIYIGGGVRNSYQDGIYSSMENQTDFWEYDMNTGIWTEKRVLPYETNYAGFINSSVATSTKGYVFTRNRDLWQYTPENDSWEKLNPLRSGPIFRSNSKLLSHNDHLYLAGGYTYLDNGTNLRDFWKYDLTTGEWILLDMFDVYFRTSDVQTFVYNDKVLVGYSSQPFYGSKPLYVEIDIP